MPENPFSVLGIKPALALDSQHLEASYREASKGCHPDSPGGNTEAFAALGTARAILASPSTRIPAALEALGHSEDGSGQPSPASRSVSMPGELIDLFAELEPAIQRVEAIARKKTAAHSELARALLAPEELAARHQLETASEKTAALIETRCQGLVELDRALSTTPDTASRAARRIATDSAFLEKWRDQVRATLMKLFV